MSGLWEFAVNEGKGRYSLSDKSVSESTHMRNFVGLHKLKVVVMSFNRTESGIGFWLAQKVIFMPTASKGFEVFFTQVGYVQQSV